MESLGYIPHFPLKLGSVLPYLLLVQPGLDYQRLQIGLDLKSDLAMHSGDMVGQWWQYHQLWVWSSFSCYSLVVWSDMGVRRRIFYLCEGDVCFQLERHNSQLFNSSSQSTFFIIKWSSFGDPFSFQVCRAALLWAQSAERVALFHLQGFLQHFSGSDLAAASLSVSERWEIAASMSSNPSRQAWEFSSDSCCFTSRGSHWFLLI